MKKTNNKKSIEEKINTYGKAFITVLVIIILTAAAYFTYQAKKDGNNPNSIEEKYTMTEDEKKFKEEYKSIDILEDNNITYINIDEASKILEEDSGLIYFGFSANKSSLNIVPILLDAMSSSTLTKIYYVNLRPNNDETQDIRDSFTINKNKVKKTKEPSSNSYYNILSILSDKLPEYNLLTTDDKIITTGEKRLFAPTIVTVKNGTILDVYTTSDEENNENLSETEQKDLYTKFSDMISNYLSDSCSISNESGC